MTPFTEEQKQAAKSLAVFYELFHETLTSVQKPENSTTQTLVALGDYAKMLMDAQDLIGVHLNSRETLQYWIDRGEANVE